MSFNKFLSDFFESLQLFVQNNIEVVQSLSETEKAVSVGIVLSIFVIVVLFGRSSKKKKVQYVSDTSFVREEKKRTTSGSCGICGKFSNSLVYAGVKGYICKECNDLRKEEELQEKEVKPSKEKSEVEEPSLEEPFHPDDLNSEDRIPEPKILAVPEHWRIPEKSQEESENGVGRASPFRVSARQKIPYLELDPRVEKDVFSTIAGFTLLFDEKPLKVHQNWARFRSSYGVSVLNNLPETMKYSTPNCHSCGKRGDDNQRCSICGNYYCVDHVWPESHGCQLIADRIWTNHR